jgi:hypothetical protein
VLRTFDAAAAIHASGDWRLDLLVGRPVDPEPGAFDDGTSDTQALWTAYATRATGAQAGIDLYYIGYENDAARFDQGAGAEERHTLGSRWFGADEAWDWNFELFGQLGRFDGLEGGGDIRAWSVASDSGYTLHDAPLAPRLGLKANVISGDDDPDDRDLPTFNPLFPKGKYFGEAGLIGPANLVNVHPSLTLALAPDWTLELASVLFWRESTGDGIYDAGGGLLRAGGGSDERAIGTQFDATLTFAPHRTLEVSLGYSTFLPGAFFEDTGTDDTLHFLGIEVLFRF